jgi:hypothetical protein
MRVKVLYIAGCGRSGSTILGHVLGQAKDWCFIGEAMWGNPQPPATRLCGCRAVLSECDFWKAVRQQIALAGETARAPEFFGLGRLARWRHLPLTFGRSSERRLESHFGERWRSCQRLYPAIAAASGAEVIVDSSKSVPYARMLGLVPELDLDVLHLVRDARAVAHSWNRRKPAPDRPDRPDLRQRTPVNAAVHWATSNLATELLGRRAPDHYLRLRYEDFVTRPRESVDRIARMVTRRPLDLPWIDDRTLDLRATHSVAGNPDRVATGPVELRLDARWTTGMRPADRRLVTALTWPLLLRYGYLPGYADANGHSREASRP